MSEVARTELGQYMSAECFRYLRQYAEETAGRGLIVQAGKQRGISLTDYLTGLGESDEAEITSRLNTILGKEGTRLCLVNAITKTDKGYRVEISESACSTGMKTSQPNCAYTMGVFVGALEVISKKRFSPTETECVACGGAHCVYELEQL
ncbi:MAG TPA: 4-vinyl reductase [Chloroflexia bacterium]|nr:4-vinyl reductase [Chloroflexia bacterium]